MATAKDKVAKAAKKSYGKATYKAKPYKIPPKKKAATSNAKVNKARKKCAAMKRKPAACARLKTPSERKKMF